jgi:site-specific DNA-methyltransferase (adenine-specific)
LVHFHKSFSSTSSVGVSPPSPNHAHPAPFPVELPLRCIKLFSFIGDTVFDPFMGSGSTLVAASKCNRKGIGIEIDPGYCKIAVERLEKEDNQKT